MTAFDGARQDEDPGIRFDRLARMAEAGNWICVAEPRRRRPSQALLYVEALAGALCIAVLTLLALVVLP